MWRQKLAVLSAYVLLLFLAARTWEWYCYDLLTAVATLPDHRRILDPFQLNVRKVRAVLDHRGLVYAGIFEKHQLLSVLKASGRVTAEELAEAERCVGGDHLNPSATDPNSDIGTTNGDDGTAMALADMRFTGAEHFNEQVEDCKDSAWLVNVMVDGSSSSAAVSTGVWRRLKIRLAPFGVRFGTYSCRVDPSRLKVLAKRLKKRKTDADTEQSKSATAIDQQESIESTESSFEDTFPLPLALVIVFLYTLICAFIFSIWEDTWNYFTAFYFFFVSLSTIGLGDEMPEHPRYALSCFFFFIIGLSLLSMCVSVMHARLEAQYMAALELIDMEATESAIAAVSRYSTAATDEPPASPGAVVGSTRSGTGTVVWRNSLGPPASQRTGSPSLNSNSPSTPTQPPIAPFPPAVLGVLMASRRSAYADSMRRQYSGVRQSTFSHSGESSDELQLSQSRVGGLKTYLYLDGEGGSTDLAHVRSSPSALSQSGSSRGLRDLTAKPTPQTSSPIAREQAGRQQSSSAVLEAISEDKNEIAKGGLLTIRLESTPTDLA